jgi:hypothetical protein
MNGGEVRVSTIEDMIDVEEKGKREKRKKQGRRGSFALERESNTALLIINI